MLFNSAHFILFFIIITLAYFSLGYSNRWKLLLIASCYFYMVFKPIYIFILFFTILIDYYAGILIEKSNKKDKKFYLILSLLLNIGVLFFFKYYNFFNANLSRILDTLVIQNPLPVLEILLPIGLSFHTFQSMSYTIEVYRGNQKAEKRFGIYALYVMFYPQLVAGPIERPQNLLQQLKVHHKFEWHRVKAGLMLMAWGLFKKVVADRLAIFVDYAYHNPAEKSGLTLLLATFFYYFQIYCDFSGYCYIAIGASKVMGFKLMDNFNRPYLASSISDFWRRWHISLSSWFKDYLYIPLGGSKKGLFYKSLNILIVFTISGLWHGASWTFICWGFLHGCYLIIADLIEKYMPENIKIKFLNIEKIQIFITFILVMFSWVFFRARNLSDALIIYKNIFNMDLSFNLGNNFNDYELIFVIILIFCLIKFDQLKNNFPIKSDLKFISIFSLLLLLSYFFGVFDGTNFIYFQF